MDQNIHLEFLFETINQNYAVVFAFQLRRSRLSMFLYQHCQISRQAVRSKEVEAIKFKLQAAKQKPVLTQGGSLLCSQAPVFCRERF
jgi:hypothetical protein